MINPSAPGWIAKFFLRQKPVVNTSTSTKDVVDFYLQLRATGFIYGHTVSINALNPVATKGWQEDEISKVALLSSLFQIFEITAKSTETEKFLKKALEFYHQMNPKGFDLFKKILPGNSDALNLEKIIDDRVRTNDNFISKNFSHIVTNALLFVDILAFEKFLVAGNIPDKYLKKIEELIVNVVSLALQTKTNKSTHDTLLIKLFESSVRYSKFSTNSIKSHAFEQMEFLDSFLEKYYLIDLAGMAVWSDRQIENDETVFLLSLANQLNVDDEFVDNSIKATSQFITLHKKNIPYFNYSNPVKHFYDRMTQSVVVLITRNKSRLIKEIRQSRELMVLLAQSTRRDLNEKEKKKVKKQILEICKTIPSLTIFLLPGGSLLLPILIKFIPQLLPSAFNENSNND